MSATDNLGQQWPGETGMKIFVGLQKEKIDRARTARESGDTNRAHFFLNSAALERRSVQRWRK